MDTHRQHLRQSLDLRLTQRLALTPSLLQKIELLQLNKLELQEMLTQALIDNPILEEATEPEPTAELNADEKPQPEAADIAGEGDRDSFEEIDFQYFFDEYLDTGYKNREVEDPEKPSFESFLVRLPSLTDHLTSQLGLSDADERITEIASQIIGNLDDGGYLLLTIEELCDLTASTREEAEQALKLVQGLDPIGVAARDLRECLLLQLDALGCRDSLAWMIVGEHLALLENHRLKELSARTGAAFEAVLQAFDIIKHLIPKPGQKYNPQNVTYVQPEVTIAKVGGEYVIIQNEDGMPQLRLNSSYRDLLKSNGVSSETKSFVREKFRAAVDLLRSLSQRKRTIYRVCECIISRQRDFLEYGPTKLRPMLIKDVANELGVHSSTIGRVVTNKYVDTPQGVMELRKFFTMGVESPDGEEFSMVQIKLKIRKLIESETKEKPYSDNQIGQMLRRDNVFITRRTVAKYREQMQIAGSRERRISYIMQQ